MTMQNTTTTTGLALQVERVRKDVKLKDLAAALSVSPGWVTRTEQRRTVTPEAAQRYRDALATFPTLMQDESAA